MGLASPHLPISGLLPGGAFGSTEHHHPPQNHLPSLQVYQALCRGAPVTPLPASQSPTTVCSFLGDPRVGQVVTPGICLCIHSPENPAQPPAYSSNLRSSTPSSGKPSLPHFPYQHPVNPVSTSPTELRRLPALHWPPGPHRRLAPSKHSGTLVGAWEGRNSYLLQSPPSPY